jgi:3-oxoacyl-[acyl-carrier-protein] synthase-3
MALAKVFGSKITGIVSVVAPIISDNLKTSLIPVPSREALVQHTGIRFRRNSEVTSQTKDYFSFAVSALLEKLNWDISTIDVFICVTQTPQVSIPSISCQLHGELAMSTNTLCYDINSGCSGFVYGIHTVNSLLSTIDKPLKRAVLCCGDLSSTITRSDDLTVLPIFSDAVSAIAIEVDNNSTETTGYFHLQTAGAGQDAIALKSHSDGKSYMTLNGIDVFNYSVSMVPKNITTLLEFAKKPFDFPDYYFLHQANKLINDSICKKISIPADKAPSSLYHYGNTASASIPVTINDSWGQGIKTTKWIVLSGFGVGFSVASCLIYFDPKLCEKPLIYPSNLLRNE